MHRYTLYQVMVFSTMSTLKLCIKSTRVDFSGNLSKSWNLPYLQKLVRFTWLHFAQLQYFRKHIEKWVHVEKNLIYSILIEIITSLFKFKRTMYTICYIRLQCISNFDSWASSQKCMLIVKDLFSLNAFCRLFCQLCTMFLDLMWTTVMKIA